MAWITAEAGGPSDLRRAAVILGAADRIWRDVGLSKLRDAPYYQSLHQQCEAKLRAGLGDILVKLGFTSRAQVAAYLAANRHPNRQREGPSRS